MSNRCLRTVSRLARLIAPAALLVALLAPAVAVAQPSGPLCPGAFFPGWKDFGVNGQGWNVFPDDWPPAPIGTNKTDPTEIQLELCVYGYCYGPGYEVVDLVPAEWDVVALTPSCGSATWTDDRNGKGKQRKLAPDEIHWDLTGCPYDVNSCMTVTVATGANPGKRRQRPATQYEPTACGPVLINDGPVLFDADGNRSNVGGFEALAIAACRDESGEGCVDVDWDGWSVDCGDCDDDNGFTYPGAPEICDGLDNDCDEELDEGGATGSVAVTAGSTYAASQGLWGFPDPTPPVTPILGTPLVGQLVDVGGDGCAADPLDYSAGPAVPYVNSVAGNIALIARGACFFEEKLGVAEAAGAIGIVVYDLAPEPLIAANGITGQTYGIPFFFVGDADGAALLGQAPVEVTLSGGCPVPD